MTLLFIRWNFWKDKVNFFEETTKVDVVFLVDKSGSMSSDSRMQTTKDALT